MKTVAVIVSGGIVNIVNSTLTKLINSPDSISFRINPDSTINQTYNKCVYSLNLLPLAKL